MKDLQEIDKAIMEVYFEINSSLKVFLAFLLTAQSERLRLCSFFFFRYMYDISFNEEPYLLISSLPDHNSLFFTILICTICSCATGIHSVKTDSG